MKHIFTAVVAATICASAMGQPRYNMEKIQREQLNRGVVAIKQDDGHVIVSWRTLYSDKKGEPFDIYRNGVKLNGSPLTAGGTFYVDQEPLSTDATYEIRGGGHDGSYTLKADAPAGYIPIKMQKPEGGITPDGREYSYSANDASVGDVDGDGQYEIILKWDPSNAHDNSHSGFTGNTLFDCYRLDGTRLWRIDMGPNIRSGAHYVPFVVYDFDGDGRAELMVKTADGTIDGTGKAIGDPKADWREEITGALANFEKNRELMKKEQAEMEKRRKEWEQARNRDRQQANRNNGRPRGRGWRGPQRNRPDLGYNQRLAGRILKGPEYITVFNGLTGEAMATEAYIPERGDVRDWGDDNGNRSERYLASMGFFDGVHPSALFCRGYYTRTVLAAWNWDGKKLTNLWTFDTNDKRWSDYAGQGNHNLRVADVDADGCDEVLYGSMAVDHDGTGLYNTGMGHGDAMHLTVFDPTSDKLQLWDCHENRRDGSDLRDAATGKVIFQIKSREDVGRCMAADIDPTNPGLEMWSSDSHGIRNIKGELVTPRRTKAEEEADKEKAEEDDTALFLRGMRLPTNSAVWWDGDLLREMLDHNRVSKYDWTTGKMLLVKEFDGCQFNNGTKSNPCLSADILGDWREEVLVRTTDSNELRLYVSPIPTDYRINCLMEDIPYRIGVATENVGYNQPPHTGFYLGPDKSVTDFLK